MKTEAQILKALENLEKSETFIYADDNGIHIPAIEWQYYMVNWIKKLVLDDPSLRHKRMFFCNGHLKSYLQDDELGAIGLGCPQCLPKNSQEQLPNNEA